MVNIRKLRKRIFFMKARFDVLRKDKNIYHEAEVIGTSFDSDVKWVHFHFLRLNKNHDEWIEVGSPRILLHRSLTGVALKETDQEKFTKKSNFTQDKNKSIDKARKKNRKKKKKHE
mmetsp:Transcript_7882/g.11505  ORF Transcript_7882/g.11505 Transcript_7882/m.11505 type:complete len:116 (+) Transcript_7882:305-652(+)